MNIICPNKNDPHYKELAHIVGSPELAHLLWNRNGGYPLDFDPKGFKSKLFEQLLEVTDNDRNEATRLKAQYYLEEYTDENGLWYEAYTEEPNAPITPIEPDKFNNSTKLLSFLEKYGFEIHDTDDLLINLAGKKIDLNTSDISQVSKALSEPLSEMLSYSEYFYNIEREVRNTKRFKDRVKELETIEPDSTRRNNRRIATKEIFKELLENGFNKKLISGLSISDGLISRIKAFIQDVINTLKGLSSDVIYNQINDIVEKTFKGEDFIRVTKKEGYIQVDFQKSFDENDIASDIMTKIGTNPNITLTGSIAYATQGTVYRHAKTAVHDLDFVNSGLSEEEIENLVLSNYPDSVKAYSFFDKYQTDTYLIPPKGITVENVKRRETGKITSYDLVKDGSIVGTYRLAYDISDTGKTINEHETKTGVEAMLVDFFSNDKTERFTVKYEFIGNDKVKHKVNLSEFSAPFEAKLRYSRFKDIWDYNRFVPYSKEEYDAGTTDEGLLTELANRLSSKFGYEWDFAKEGELPESARAGFRFTGEHPIVIFDKESTETGDIVHEFGHILIGYIKRDNPELYKALVEEFHAMPDEFKKKMKHDINLMYSGYPDKAKEDEILTKLLEDYADDLIDKETGLFKALDDIWQYIKQFIADAFGIVNVSELSPKTTLKQLAYMMMDPSITLKLGDTFGSGEFLENYSGVYDFSIPYKKRATEDRVETELSPEEIVQKIMAHSQGIEQEQDKQLAKDKGRYKYNKDGSIEYLSGVTQRMGKEGYGWGGETNDDSIFIKVGNTIHDTIHNIQTGVIEDLAEKYGITMTAKAKKNVKDIFKKLVEEIGTEKEVTVLSEVIISDKQYGLASKVDLILIAPDGRVMIYDFKTKLRYITRNAEGLLEDKGSRFYWWNSSSHGGITDRDKVHLQLSIYAHMLEKIIGKEITSISAVRLDAYTSDEGKTIDKVEIYSSDENILTESYYDKRGLVKSHHRTRQTYYRDKDAYLVDDNSLNEMARTRNDYEESLYQKLNTPESKTGMLLEELRKDLVNRLKFARKRYEYDKRQSLEDVMERLQEEESVTESLYEIIDYSAKEIFDIRDTVNAYLKEGKDFTPGLLYRWRDAVQSFKNLEKIKNALYENKELVPSKKYLIMLNESLGQISRLENLYKTEGRVLIAKWLTPYYHGIKVKFEDVYKSEYRKLKYREVKRGKKSLDQFEQDYGSMDDYVSKRVNNNKVKEDTFTLLYKELEIAGRDIGELTRWIDNMLDTPDAVSAALVNAFVQQEEKGRLEAIDKRGEVSDMLEELMKVHTKTTFMSEEDFYSFMLEHNDKGDPTQFILRPYKSDFYTELMEARKESKQGGREAAATNQVIANLKIAMGKFDTDEFLEALGIYTGELLNNNEITVEEYEAIRDKVETTEHFYITHIKTTNVVREETVNKISYWYSKNRPLFFNYNDKYMNPEWEKFMNLLGIDKNLSMYKQMDMVRKSSNIYARFYTYIEDMNREANQMIPFGYRTYDRLPGVIKLNSERLTAGQNPLSIAKENFKTDLFVKPEDVERGNPEWTNEEHRVKYYIPVNYTSKVAAIDQSYDLPTIYFKFWESANDFRNKRNILPELEMTRYFINSRKAYQRNVFSKMVKNSTGVDDEAAIKDTTVLSAMFNDWFDMALYGKTSKDLKDPIKINDKYAFDPMKFIDAVNRFTSLNLLSLNLVQGTANIAMGEMMQTIEAIAHEYVNPKTYTKALLKYDVLLPGVLGDAGRTLPESLGGLIYQEFNILDESPTDIAFSKTSLFGKMFKNTSVYMLQHMGEHWLQNRFLLAMMMSKNMVDLNGNDIGNLVDQYVKVGKKLQLKQKGELSAVDYQAFLKKNNWTDKEQTEFKQKVKGVLSRMHGEYSDLGRVALQRIAAGRMAYLFRKWIVPGWRRRWGRPQYSERLQQQVEGSYVTTLKFFRNYAKELATFQFAIMGENWAGLSDHEKANIYRTLSEAAFLVGAIILAGFAFKMKGDDPEDEWLWSFLSYQSYRLKTEILFFVSPGAFMQIMRSPMAPMAMFDDISQLFTQMLDPSEVYTRGPLKGQLKLKKNMIDLIPMLKQYYRLRDIEQQIGWFKRTATVSSASQ